MGRTSVLWRRNWLGDGELILHLLPHLDPMKTGLCFCMLVGRGKNRCHCLAVATTQDGSSATQRWRGRGLLIFTSCHMVSVLGSYERWELPLGCQAHWSSSELCRKRGLHSPPALMLMWVSMWESICSTQLSPTAKYRPPSSPELWERDLLMSTSC